MKYGGAIPYRPLACRTDRARLSSALHLRSELMAGTAISSKQLRDKAKACRDEADGRETLT